MIIIGDIIDVLILLSVTGRIIYDTHNRPAATPFLSPYNSELSIYHIRLLTDKSSLVQMTLSVSWSALSPIKGLKLPVNGEAKFSEVIDTFEKLAIIFISNMIFMPTTRSASALKTF